MGLTVEQQQVRDLLTETVTLLCKNGLQFGHELGIEALIGITLDKEEVFLVSIKETIFSDRKTIDNSSSDSSCTDEAIDSVSLVSQTFVGKESFKDPQECGKSEKNNLKSYCVAVDSCTKFSTHNNSSSSQKNEVIFKEIEDDTDIIECSYEVPRKRNGGNSNSRTSLTVALDQKSNFSVSSDSKKPSSTACKNENINFNGSAMSSESCVIEMKREIVDEEDAENSYNVAIGSLYPNSFDDCNGWNWKTSHWRPKRMSEKVSSDKQLIQCNSNTSIWNARSQKPRTRQSCVRTAADVRPDETDARRCPICGIVSLNWNMYLRHIRKHQPGMYRCPFCGKSFSGSTNLRGHLAVHTNIREFTCHLCDKAYAYKKDLSEHLMVKHGQMQSRFHLLANFSPTVTSHGLDIAELLEEKNI